MSDRNHAGPLGAGEKLLDLPRLLERFGRPREGTLVFTNGVFDVLHRGHVEYLEAARALGDWLVVGLNSDQSVRRLKGPSRPVNSQEDRAVVLGGLAVVDAVVVFGEDTPLRLVEALLPDVIVKGGDYTPESVVGAREVVAAGGRVVIAPLLAGRSTTRIVERIQGNEIP
jgi:D-beta-D-heptose 7-phosphate kinase/D-beta-D-heptose 1-phosphate adenosyltransferase